MQRAFSFRRKHCFWGVRARIWIKGRNRNNFQKLLEVLLKILTLSKVNQTPFVLIKLLSLVLIVWMTTDVLLRSVGFVANESSFFPITLISCRRSTSKPGKIDTINSVSTCWIFPSRIVAFGTSIWRSKGAIRIILLHWSGWFFIELRVTSFWVL